MSSRKEKAVSRANDIIYKGDAPLRVSKLPVPLQFPLVVILSLSLSALLYSFAAEYTAGELSTVSRRLEKWWEVGALVTWRTFELGLGWFGNYDGYDLASLGVLSHGPPLYLLHAFYAINPSTVLISLTIDVLATSIPFRLLRPLSAAHAHAHSTSPSPSGPLPNRIIVTDPSIQILTATLAAAIYSVTLYAAYASYLPPILVTHFDNIPTIAAAHRATPITLLPVTLILGLASRSFIFTPAVTSSEVGKSDVASGPAAAAASLKNTLLLQHLWDSFHPRSRIVIARTASLVLVVGGNAFLQVFLTVEGVDAVGAAAYAAIWVGAALLTGLSLGIVGAV